MFPSKRGSGGPFWESAREWGRPLYLRTKSRSLVLVPTAMSRKRGHCVKAEVSNKVDYQRGVESPTPPPPRVKFSPLSLGLSNTKKVSRSGPFVGVEDSGTSLSHSTTPCVM